MQQLIINWIISQGKYLLVSARQEVVNASHIMRHECGGLGVCVFPPVFWLENSAIICKPQLSAVQLGPTYHCDTQTCLTKEN